MQRGGSIAIKTDEGLLENCPLCHVIPHLPGGEGRAPELE
jgi:hypothetical protein